MFATMTRTVLRSGIGLLANIQVSQRFGMNRSSIVVVMLLTLLGSASTFAQTSKEESVEIPLNQIYGYNLTGTKDVAGLPLGEPVQGQTYATLERLRDYGIERIRQTLASKSPKERAVAGFVLRNQPDASILSGVSSKLRPKQFTFAEGMPEGEYTLVFFTHPLSYYCRLRKVEWKGEEENTITVEYQFEPHMRPEATVHFALIPLGHLPEGKYHVHYEQIPIDESYRKMGFEPVMDDAHIVCHDFAFEVSNRPVEKPGFRNR